MLKESSISSQYTSGGVKLLLRVEGLCVLIASCIVYNNINSDWKEFFWLFFIPDISLLGYLVGKKFGAIAYNTLHSYILPINLFLIAYLANHPQIFPYIIIWVAHIGFDRVLGYGLKYASGFNDTHLGKIQGWKIKNNSKN